MENLMALMLVNIISGISVGVILHYIFDDNNR